MADYDIFQQIYVQAFAADLMSVVSGSEWALQLAFSWAVKKAIAILNKQSPPDWAVQWGPRLFKDNTLGSAGLDNAWFISFASGVKYLDGSSFDTYVLSIAGTAVVSKADWLIQDFKVQEVVDFSAWIKLWGKDSIPPPTPATDVSTGGPFVAYGTSFGVYNLVSQPQTRDDKDPTNTIIKFITGLQPGKKTRLVVTGHSLGGALAPYLSLALAQSGLLDPNIELLVVPAAGATPGDEAFSTMYSQKFPTRREANKSYQAWSADFYNTLDIVPQAFQAIKGADRSLYNIPNIYGIITEPITVQKVLLPVAAGIGLGVLSGIKYFPIDGNAFTGPKPSGIPDSFTAFMLEAVKQHVLAYTDEIGITSLVSQVYHELFKDKQVRPVNLVEATQRFPVLRQAQAHRQLPEGSKEVYPYDDLFKGKKA
ncbi:hypothetical protein KVT40_008479 [Elsinoe batatas]|uniref:Fungal lipase-type domain-containing protein n=1 Tax=Elsinoe batatas TaxID=2601811 RepID=A0A8K0PDV6_9PEZI|nr:hypothetical protein KVT40_008479 [Elsinoe batatas]